MIQFTQKDFLFARKLCAIFDNCRAPCLLVENSIDWCDGCVVCKFSDTLRNCGSYIAILSVLGLYRNYPGIKPDKIVFMRRIIYTAGVMYSANNNSSPIISEKRIDKLLRILQGNPRAFLRIACKKTNDSYIFYWLPGLKGECKKEKITDAFWNLILFLILIFILGADEEEKRGEKRVEKMKESDKVGSVKKLITYAPDFQTPEEFFLMHNRGEKLSPE